MDRSDEAKRDHDVDRQAREWAETLRTKHGIKNSDVTKARSDHLSDPSIIRFQIMTYNQMVREYSQTLDKARLANTYDIFLVDNTLLTKAFSFLGQNFKKPGK